MAMNPTTSLALPALSEQQWRTALNTFAGKTDIPTGETERTRPEAPDACPARTKLASSIAAAHALDELAQDDPQVTATLRPFLSLSEAEAMTVLFVNNLMWETGQALWQPAPDPAA